MPAWLINALVSLAIKIGFPLLLKYIPWLPNEVLVIIEKLLSDLQKPDISNSMAKKTALRDVKEYCSGVGCPAETKQL